MRTATLSRFRGRLVLAAVALIEHPPIALGHDIYTTLESPLSIRCIEGAEYEHFGRPTSMHVR